jgi:hypothetical protein
MLSPLTVAKHCECEEYQAPQWFGAQVKLVPYAGHHPITMGRRGSLILVTHTDMESSQQRLVKYKVKGP